MRRGPLDDCSSGLSLSGSLSYYKDRSPAVDYHQHGSYSYWDYTQYNSYMDPPQGWDGYFPYRDTYRHLLPFLPSTYKPDKLQLQQTASAMDRLSGVPLASSSKIMLPPRPVLLDISSNQDKAFDSFHQLHDQLQVEDTGMHGMSVTLTSTEFDSDSFTLSQKHTYSSLFFCHAPLWSQLDSFRELL